MDDELQKLQQKLEAAREAREEAARAREAAQQADVLAMELARITKATEMDGVFAELQAEHGLEDVRRVDTSDGHMIAIKRPARVAFRRFQQSKGQIDDCDQLVRTCLVYPGRDIYNDIVGKYPGKIVECANAAAALAGITVQESAGK